MSIDHRRFNAGIQRAKGFLELASALYEGSLAEKQVDSTTGAIQTISPVGHQITIVLENEGFPIVVHVDMPEKVAYAICDAIERRKGTIPIDKEGELDMAQLCGNDDEAPRNGPLHPGAERFYRERGYLKG